MFRLHRDAVHALPTVMFRLHCDAVHAVHTVMFWIHGDAVHALRTVMFRLHRNAVHALHTVMFRLHCNAAYTPHTMMFQLQNVLFSPLCSLLLYRIRFSNTSTMQSVRWHAYLLETCLLLLAVWSIINVIWRHAYNILNSPPPPFHKCLVEYQNICSAFPRLRNGRTGDVPKLSHWSLLYSGNCHHPLSPASDKWCMDMRMGKANCLSW